eukprot:2009442-Rhodomonas_salina.1
MSGRSGTCTSSCCQSHRRSERGCQSITLSATDSRRIGVQRPHRPGLAPRAAARTEQGGAAGGGRAGGD